MTLSKADLSSTGKLSTLPLLVATASGSQSRCWYAAKVNVRKRTTNIGKIKDLRRSLVFNQLRTVCKSDGDAN